ncbi:MAG: hypothetical protein U0Q15_04270 [Kineosporiaceae bacterium]
MRPTSVRAAVAAVLAVTLLGGCSSDPAAYRDSARTAVEDARAELATIALAAQQWDRGRLTAPYAQTTVDDAEQALGKAADGLAAQQPPTRADDTLRDAVGDLLDDASAAASRTRIALRRGDHAGVRDGLSTLDAVRADLDDAETALRDGTPLPKAG